MQFKKYERHPIKSEFLSETETRRIEKNLKYVERIKSFDEKWKGAVVVKKNVGLARAG